jgi:hypothetical protein
VVLPLNVVLQRGFVWAFDKRGVNDRVQVLLVEGDWIEKFFPSMSLLVLESYCIDVEEIFKMLQRRMPGFGTL